MSGPNIFEHVDDVVLRPWTMDPIVDARLEEEASDFEDCLCATSHSKSAGGLGQSILDKPPRDNWHLRSCRTTTIAEFEDQLRTIIENQNMEEEEEDERTGEDKEFDDPSNSMAFNDVDIMVLDNELTSEPTVEGDDNAERLPEPKRPLTKQEKRMLIKALKHEKVLKAKEKKALSAVKYVHREGLHTIQVPIKKHKKLKKPTTLTVKLNRGQVDDYDEQNVPTLYSDLIGESEPADYMNSEANNNDLGNSFSGFDSSVSDVPRTARPGTTSSNRPGTTSTNRPGTTSSVRPTTSSSQQPPLSRSMSFDGAQAAANERAIGSRSDSVRPSTSQQNNLKQKRAMTPLQTLTPLRLPDDNARGSSQGDAATLDSLPQRSSSISLPAITSPGALRLGSGSISAMSPVKGTQSAPFPSTPDSRFDLARATTPALSRLSISASLNQVPIGHIMSRSKIQEKRRLKDQVKSVTGASTIIFHDEFPVDALPDLQSWFDQTRQQAQETDAYMREDHMSAFFVTSGLEEVYGSANLFKSQYAAEYEGHPGYVKQVTGAEITKDSFTEWRESANKLGYKV